MFKILIDYPNKSDEVKIIERFTEGIKLSVLKTMSSKEIIKIQRTSFS